MWDIMNALSKIKHERPTFEPINLEDFTWEIERDTVQTVTE